jgi:hypothetical protein
MPGSVLDLVDASGNDCTLSPGDVVQVRAAPAPGAQAVNATVLASKGGSECAADTSVRMPLADLQESENYMRQSLEQGMADLQAKQGTGNLPPAPAAAQGALVNAGFATGAPPPDANAEAEIASSTALRTRRSGRVSAPTRSSSYGVKPIRHDSAGRPSLIGGVIDASPANPPTARS